MSPKYVARGEPLNKLMLNLFKEYSAVDDDAFTRYIGWKQDAYEDNVEITADSLMMNELSKYELRMENGTWNSLSRKDDRIVALQTQIDSLGTQKEPTNGKKKSISKNKDGDEYAWKNSQMKIQRKWKKEKLTIGIRNIERGLSILLCSAT
jgi:hypothetical protein